MLLELEEQKKKWKEYREKFYLIPENRDKKREHDKIYQRNRRVKLIGYKTKEYRKYCKENPEKVWAQSTLNRYIKNKKIKRSFCEMCGISQNIHGHHPDYSKPFSVIWLCPIHHKEIHNK